MSGSRAPRPVDLVLGKSHRSKDIGSRSILVVLVEHTHMLTLKTDVKEGTRIHVLLKAPSRRDFETHIRSK